jgi:hypothetical protein
MPTLSLLFEPARRIFWGTFPAHHVILSPSEAARGGLFLTTESVAEPCMQCPMFVGRLSWNSLSKAGLTPDDDPKTLSQLPTQPPLPIRCGNLSIAEDRQICLVILVLKEDDILC